MKKIIGVVLVGVCVLLVGCGEPDQEKVAEERAVEQPKIKKDKQKIMGDGNKKSELLKPGKSIGGL